MSEYKGEEWVIHQVYVDETQDFTQAELSLLISCCQNPNDMFLTGELDKSLFDTQCLYFWHIYCPHPKDKGR